MRQVSRCEGAPRAVGPYSQAIVAAGFVWVSGQIALDPSTGTLVGPDVEAEARQALRNLKAVLDAAGSGLERVVRATLYLTDMEDFERVNRVWAESFGGDPPARACVEVRRLPRGARVEVDAVAIV